MCGNVVSRLALIGGIEFDILFAIEVGILVEQTSAELLPEHILYSPFQHFGLYQSLIDSLLQMLIIGTVGEVHIVAAVDGCCRLLDNIV